MNKEKQILPEGANPLLLGRDTLNPYRFSVRTLLSRLLWDLHPESWRSRRKLIKLSNSQIGRKAVIICNGPSLNNIKLEALAGIYTLGLNKINLLFEKSSFRPSCIVSANPFVIRQNAEYFNQTSIPLFLDSSAIRIVRAASHVTFFNSSPEPRLARNCSISLHQGFTVTCVAMQLAFHMGFRDVALIGCDHNFIGSGQRNQVVQAGEMDLNHFSPNYFSGQQKWQLPDLLGSEYFYKLAYETYEHAGRRLVNCTIGGRLEILPRMSLEDWIGDVI